MFAVIYRIKIKPGKELEYQKHWKTVTQYFKSERGAIGSCLHKTDEGYWAAYSRWPDKETRDASWPGEDAPSDILPQTVKDAIYTMREITIQENKLPEICMETVIDYL